MKKFILTIGFLLLAYIGFSQVTNSRVLRVANNTTDFGENLPKGSYVYDMNAKILYVLDAGAASTEDLTSVGANKTAINAAPSTEVQDETYNSTNFDNDVTHAVSQDDFYDYQHTGDTDDDALVNKVDLSSAGFVKTDASGVLSVDANTYLTAEVDGSVSNEGSLTVTDGSDEADIVSNTSGSTNVSIVGGTGINVEGTSGHITINYDGTAVTTRLTQWVEVAADDLTQPYPVTLSQTPNANTKITVQINGVPIKYAAGTTNGTFNYSGTALSIYANVYQYDQIEIDYEY